MNFEESYNKNVLENQKSGIANMNQNTYANSIYSDKNRQNLIEYELDFTPELEEIGTLLRGDVEVTENGSTFWTRPFKDIMISLYELDNVVYYVNDNTLIKIQIDNNIIEINNIKFKTEEGYLKLDKFDLSLLNFTLEEPKFIGYRKVRITDNARTFLNDLGVNDMLRNIIILVNKNKALSNYSAEEINDRVKQLKHEISTLIYNNYEDYGIDNEYKMNNYPMTVLAVGSIVEDVYRRAMNGETHKGLAEQRLVTQTEGISQQSFQPQAQGKKHWWNRG